MNFYFSEMVAAAYEQDSATPEKFLTSGGTRLTAPARLAAPLTGSKSSPTQQRHPLQTDQVSPDYISACVQTPQGAVPLQPPFVHILF